MLNWNEYLTEVKTGVSQIAKLNPGVVRGYSGIGSAKPANPQLDDKTRELIALAVAVTVRCDGCIAVHTASAKKLGSTQEEIMEALGIAVAVNAGAALVYSIRTMNAYESLEVAP